MKQLLVTVIAAVLLLGCGESERKPTSILHAVDLRNIEAVKKYITAGTDVNTKDAIGITPLLLAVSKGQKEIVELLIAEGADVNAQMVGGVTPLDLSIMKDETEIADLLRKHGGKTGEELKAEGK